MNRAREVPATTASAARPVDEPALRLRGCEARFDTADGPAYTAVREIDLDVRAGTFVSIVGPTGCGKSTILNMAAGLLTPAAGTVASAGAPVSGTNPVAGYMFQQDALLPWKTALDNVALPLRYRGVSRSEASARAHEWLARVGLAAYADRHPAQLSGGQRRRVAMAQVWITNPQLILMDEPFSALDVQTRLVMENELLELWSQTRATTLFVTHDLDEAVGLSDEIVVLSAGPASTVAGRFTVGIDRPRDLLEIKRLPEYRRIFDEVWECLKREVMKTHAIH